MKQIYILLVAICAIAFTACSKDDGNTDFSGKGEPIIMTALVDEHNEYFSFLFYFNEKDTLIIDWGDGCMERYELEQENSNGGLLNFKCEPEHRYTSVGNKIISCSFKEKNVKESLTQLEYNKSKADLVSLDVSDCVALVKLDFLAAQIDASGCEALATLDVSDSELTSLNLNGCKWLTYLDCHNNELNSLDLSTNTALQELICWHCRQLSSLDISKNIALVRLKCNGCLLSSIDLSKNIKLKELECWENKLTFLDISKNTTLEKLLCRGNQLTSLDVSKNIALKTLDCNDNNFSASALNKIFNDLPQGKTWYGNDFKQQSTIYIGDNPGTDTCDKSIAENKGWIVSID